MQVEIHSRIDAQALIEAGRLLRLKPNLRVRAFVETITPASHQQAQLLDMRLALNYNS